MMYNMVGASGGGSAFSAIGSSPSLTAFLMIGHAQFVTIQSQLGSLLTFTSLHLLVNHFFSFCH
jgi:hypothetical protein